jgi:FAD/FMN-containing dehydrogenase
MPSPMSQIHLHQMGGAVSRVPADATAYSGREAAFTYNLVSTWLDPAEDGTHIEANRLLATALAPLALPGSYVNFLSDENEAQVRDAYGPSYARMAALKRAWDPENLFRRNQNVSPA